ncbi:MAG: hypothetical protein ACUVRK_01265 [Spirochaetota bacterium]
MRIGIMRIVILGAGVVGYQIAKQLISEDKDVVINTLKVWESSGQLHLSQIQAI